MTRGTTDRVRAQTPYDPIQLNGWLSFAITRYLFNRPEDEARLRPLRAAIAGDADLGSRSTFPLHVTASAVALDAARERIVMVEHAFLRRTLCPGGHLDPGEIPPQAAARELLEEAGMAGTAISVSGGAIDIDIHAIPENPAKGEPAHEHADFAFAFSVSGEPRGNAESSAVGWHGRGILLEDLRGRRILDRIIKARWHR